MLKAHKVRRADCISGWANGPLFVCGGLICGGRVLPTTAAENCKSLGESRYLVDTNRIAQAIEPPLAAMGYRLVRVVLTSGRSMPGELISSI